MFRKITIVGVAVSSLWILASGVASAELKQVPTVRLHAEASVNAPPAAIWAHMTRGKNLVTW